MELVIVTLVFYFLTMALIILNFKISTERPGNISINTVIIAALLLLILAVLGLLFRHPVIILLLVIVAIWIRYMKEC
jgi:hypothetical protein